MIVGREVRVLADDHMTKHTQRIREAFERGLRVNEAGEVIGLLGRVRSPQVMTSAHGYKIAKVNLTFDGKNIFITVAKLAAYQWFGEKALAADVQVRHLDGNSLNNAKDNLAIGSASDNMMDRPAEVRLTAAKAGATKVRRLSEEGVTAFRADRAAGMSLNALAKKYQVAKSTASYIVNNKTYQ